MSLDRIFGTAAISDPFVSSGSLVEDGSAVYFPSTTKVHAGLVRSMIHREKSLTVVVPSDRPEFVHILGLEALFTNTRNDRNAVFVLSSNTEFRERFRELAPKSSIPPHDRAPYSREETPIANVTTDGSLATVTKNLNHPDKLPRFLFSYTSKRIPSDEVGERVRCVIYDDSVKYHPERLEALRRWRVRNDVPTAIYLTSNPTSGVVEDLIDDVSVWSWPPQLLSEAVDADDDVGTNRWPSSDIEMNRTTSWARIARTREQNRSGGVSFEVHTCGDGDLNDLLVEANARRAKFESLVRKMDNEVLHEAKPLVRYALRDFQELLSPLDLATFHARRTSIPARIAGLDRFQRRIHSDPEASPAGGPFRGYVAVLERLEETWDDAPESHKKEGQLVSLLYAVLDREESVTVVTATEEHSLSLGAYLQTEHPRLYSDLGDDLSIHDGQSVRSAESTDNAILYGSLRWGQRDLLRTDVASNVVVLAYPIEIPLLHAQVRAVEGAFTQITDRPFWKVLDVVTRKACDGKGADIESVDIDLPDVDEAVESTLGGELSIDESEASDLGDLVRGYEPHYDSSEWVFDPEEFTSPDTLESGDPDSTGGGQMVVDCVDVHFADGHAMYLRRNDSVHVVREGHDKLLKKSVKSLKSGDLVVHLEETDTMRDQLYRLIRERGDVGLYYYANLWRVSLESALEETGDDFSDFAEKMQNQGLDKNKGTYERWYSFEVQRTRSKKSLWAIAEAYDLEMVKENFSEVWDAVQDMETIYGRLKKALREWALQSATGATHEDVMLSQSPDIRLSDFEIGRYLYRLEVSAVEREVDTKSSQIGHLRVP